MTIHRYALGQTVRFTGRTAQPRTTPEIFEIVALMPPRDGTFQYRIRSGEERHERVALEDDIEAVEAGRFAQADNNNKPGVSQPR
jgi:hypothetical protein